MSDGNQTLVMLRNAVVVLLFGAMGVGAFMWQSSRPPTLPEVEQAYVIDPARSIKWSELIAHDETVYTPENLLGKWSYLYMGYRSCPDACPTALGVLSKVSKQLSALNLKDEQKPQFLFLSVDPRRDTPKLLAEYVQFFGEDFIGVTGDNIQLKAVALQLGGLFYVPEAPETDAYEVGHSDSIYLMNPAGKLRLISRPPHDAEIIVRNHLEIID